MQLDLDAADVHFGKDVPPGFIAAPKLPITLAKSTIEAETGVSTQLLGRDLLVGQITSRVHLPWLATTAIALFVLLVAYRLWARDRGHRRPS